MLKSSHQLFPAADFSLGVLANEADAAVVITLTGLKVQADASASRLAFAKLNGVAAASYSEQVTIR